MYNIHDMYVYVYIYIHIHIHIHIYIYLQNTHELPGAATNTS